MIKTVKAFAPGNISCIFKVHTHKNPTLMGSYGIGFTIDEGVVVDVEKSEKTEVLFNNEKINIQTVQDVVNKLTNQPITIKIETKLPLGCGFGISGAAALATAYGINKLLDIKKTKKELAIIAHTAEVENKTGLGDVVNQYFGGFFLKEKPSSSFSVTKISVKEKTVYCRVFSPLSTKNVLNDKKLLSRVDAAATKALISIKNLLQQKNVALGEIFSISKQFVLESGLLKNQDVIDTIEKIEKKGGSATMIILGNAVVSTIPFKDSIKLKISDQAAHILDPETSSG